MKIQLKCDLCGKIGTPEEIITNHLNEDLCKICIPKKELKYLKQRYAHDKEWLESTYLKDLRELEKQITDLEGRLSNEKEILRNGSIED